MKVSYNQINNECNELHLLATKINDSVNRLKTLDSSLQRNSIWTGTASEYYSTKMKDLLNGFEEISVEIENSILFLAKTAEGYQAIDNMVISQICNNLNISEPNLSTSKIFS